MKMLSFLLAGTLLFASCQKKDNSAADNSGVSVSMKAVNPSATLQQNANTDALSRVQTVNLQWTSALASVNLLKFEAKSNGSEIEFKSNIRQTIDLFSATNALGNITIPPGSFSEVEFKASLSPSGSTPALVMNGQLVDNSGTTAVVFQANEAIEIKGEKNNVTLTGTTVHNAIIAMDLSKIVQGISAAELASAVRTNGTLLITANINSTLYGKIVRNLQNLEDECEFH